MQFGEMCAADPVTLQSGTLHIAIAKTVIRLFSSIDSLSMLKMGSS